MLRAVMILLALGLARAQKRSLSHIFLNEDDPLHDDEEMPARCGGLGAMSALGVEVLPMTVAEREKKCSDAGVACDGKLPSPYCDEWNDYACCTMPEVAAAMQAAEDELAFYTPRGASTADQAKFTSSTGNCFMGYLDEGGVCLDMLKWIKCAEACAVWYPRVEADEGRPASQVCYERFEARTGIDSVLGWPQNACEHAKAINSTGCAVVWVIGSEPQDVAITYTTEWENDKVPHVMCMSGALSWLTSARPSAAALVALIGVAALLAAGQPDDGE